MKAIIIAGGRGERLRPLTDTIPKPMVDINGKPVLEHIINLFKKYNIRDFVITLCYLPEKITQYFGDGKKLGVHIEYLYEDPTCPLGTAGSIAQAKKLIDSSFIVTSGDSLREINIADMIFFHKEKKSYVTVNVHKRFGENPKSMILFDKHMRITDYIERPTKDMLTDDFVWASGFFYIFEPEIFDYIPGNKSSDFGYDIYPKLLELKKAVFAYPTDGYFVDIGDEKKLAKARETYKP